MQRSRFNREFKIEAVKLVRDRGSLWPRPGETLASIRTRCANG
jgi:hypothetical protein